jgi:hypothetical protein
MRIFFGDGREPFLDAFSAFLQFGEMLISRTSKIHRFQASGVDFDEELLHFYDDLREFMSPLALYKPEE